MPDYTISLSNDEALALAYLAEQRTRLFILSHADLAPDPPITPESLLLEVTRATLRESLATVDALMAPVYQAIDAQPPPEIDPPAVLIARVPSAAVQAYLRQVLA